MNHLTIRQLSLFSYLLLVFVATGCGSSSNTPPPPPLAKFSNTSLSGQYAFSMSGSEVCAGVSSHFTRAGSFTADGKGNVTSGLEDINVCTGVGTLQFTSGKYSIGDDGRGTLRLTNSTGTTNYSIVLSSTAAGSIAETDTDATAGGSFQRQNSSAFSNAAIAGGYVFSFNGVDVSGTFVNPGSYIGRFDADGAGAIFNGLFDSNIAGTPSGQQLFPAGGFYQLDTDGNGKTFGRGTANIGGQSLVFYIVDASRLKFLTTDFPSAYIGEAFAQQNIAFTTTSLNGSFSFLIGGWSSNGPISTAGRFTTDGAGSISNIVLDENNTGYVTPLPSGGVSGTFTVDANQFGGGTITWTDTNVGSFSFIFYLICDEEDFVGQLTLTASRSLSGSLDFNEFAAAKQFFDVSLSGNLNLSGDGTQANAFNAYLQKGPAPSLHFTTYVVNQDTSLLVGTDTDRVIAGTLTRQP